MNWSQILISFGLGACAAIIGFVGTRILVRITEGDIERASKWGAKFGWYGATIASATLFLLDVQTQTVVCISLSMSLLLPALGLLAMTVEGIEKLLTKWADNIASKLRRK